MLNWSVLSSPQRQPAKTPLIFNKATPVYNESRRNLTEFKTSKNVAHILPRLRKSIKRFHPLDSVGNIWP